MPLHTRLASQATNGQFLNNVAATHQLPFLWISDRHISDALQCFIHARFKGQHGLAYRRDGCRRHGSNVPGPLEHRKRASRRKMNNLAIPLGPRDVGQIEPHFDPAQAVKGWLGSLWDRTKGMSWTWQPPQQLDTTNQPADTLNLPSEDAEVKVFTGTVATEDLQTLLQAAVDLGGIRELLAWLRYASLDRKACSIASFNHLLSLKPPISDLLGFIDDQSLNHAPFENMRSLLSRLKNVETTDEHCWSVMSRIFNDVSSGTFQLEQSRRLIYNSLQLVANSTSKNPQKVLDACEAWRDTIEDLRGVDNEAKISLYRTWSSMVQELPLGPRAAALIVETINRALQGTAWGSRRRQSVFNATHQLLVYESQQRLSVVDGITTRESALVCALKSPAFRNVYTWILYTVSRYLRSLKPDTSRRTARRTKALHLVEDFLISVRQARSFGNDKYDRLLWQAINTKLALRIRPEEMPRYFSSLGPEEARSTLLEYFFLMGRRPSRTLTEDNCYQWNFSEGVEHGASTKSAKFLRHLDKTQKVHPSVRSIFEASTTAYANHYATKREKLADWSASLVGILKTLAWSDLSDGTRVLDAYKELLGLALAMREYSAFFHVLVAGQLHLKFRPDASDTRMINRFINEVSSQRPRMAMAAFHWHPDVALSDCPHLLPHAAVFRQTRPQHIWRALARFDPKFYVQPPRPATWNSGLPERQPRLLHPSRIEILHEVATAFSKAEHLHWGYSFLCVRKLYHELFRRRAPISAEMSKAIIRAGILRPALKRMPISAERFKWILKVVKAVEGEAVALTVLQWYEANAPRSAMHWDQVTDGVRPWEAVDGLRR